MNKLLTTTALLLSLTVSGMAYAHDDSDGKQCHGGPRHGMEQALSKLPKKDADQFRDAMKQAHEQDKASFEQMHALHKDLHAILTAEKFDKDAYMAKSADIQKLQGDLRSHMTEAFANAVAQLPQKDRKILADAMHHEFEGHGSHHHGPKKSGDEAAAPSDAAPADAAPADAAPAPTPSN